MLRIRSGNKHKLIAPVAALESPGKDRALSLPSHLVISELVDSMPQGLQLVPIGSHPEGTETDQLSLDAFAKHLRKGGRDSGKRKVAVIRDAVYGDIYIAPTADDDKEHRLTCHIDASRSAAPEQAKLADALDKVVKGGGVADTEEAEVAIEKALGLNRLVSIGDVDAGQLRQLFTEKLCQSSSHYLKFGSTQHGTVTEFLLLRRDDGPFASSPRSLAADIADAYDYLTRVVCSWVPFHEQGAVMSMHFGSFRRTRNFHGHLLCDIDAFNEGVSRQRAGLGKRKREGFEQDYDSLLALVNNSCRGIELCKPGEDGRLTPAQVEVRPAGDGHYVVQRCVDGMALTWNARSKSVLWFPAYGASSQSWALPKPSGQGGALYLLGSASARPGYEKIAGAGGGGLRASCEGEPQGCHYWRLSVTADAEPGVLALGLDHAATRACGSVDVVDEPKNEFFVQDLESVFRCSIRPPEERFRWDEDGEFVMEPHGTLPYLLFRARPGAASQGGEEVRRRLLRRLIEFIQTYRLDAHIVLPVGGGPLGYTSSGRKTRLACTDAEGAEGLLAYVLVNPVQYYQYHAGDVSRWLQAYANHGNVKIYT